MTVTRNKLIVFILLLFTLVALNSCGPKKDMPSQELSQSDKQLYDNLTKNLTEWNSTEVPFSMSLTEPQRLSLSGRARIVRGKSIELSIRMLGIEMGRIVISNDSVFALYRIDKVYLAENIKSISDVMPASLSNLQDMLLGRPFMLGDKTMPTSMSDKITIDTQLDIFTLTPRKQPDNLSYGFTATRSPEVSLSRFAAVAQEHGLAVTADYTPYKGITPAGPLAETTLLTIDSKTFKASAKLVWKWRSARWDTKFETNWTAPSSYQKISARSLLKSLQK